MILMTRRAALKHAVGALAVSTGIFGHGSNLGLILLDEDEITADERSAMAKIAATFMDTFDVPGLSVAVARAGKIVYQQPLGIANRKTGEHVSTSHLFRVASVSKPITSVALFTLIQQGKIRLEDKVFGENGILGNKYGTRPYKRYVEDITIDHLLMHTCGGWEKGANDPMFLDPKVPLERLISWTIDNRLLDNPPGKQWAYSNFGYCLLGRIIETTTQQNYDAYVQRAVFDACGITDMQISGNTLQQAAKHEVVYYGQNGEKPYSMNIQRMDSAGGWIASPSDLVKFLILVGGFSTTPNVLTPETIKTMTAPCDLNKNCARGWDVNKVGNWWHTGDLPGTATIVMRTSSGFCWAALTNTRRPPTNVMSTALNKMVWDMVGEVHNWHV
jgi:CubicO group peptidase (beta-lactamase class C family)